MKPVFILGFIMAVAALYSLTKENTEPKQVPKAPPVVVKPVSDKKPMLHCKEFLTLYQRYQEQQKLPKKPGVYDPVDSYRPVVQFFVSIYERSPMSFTDPGPVVRILLDEEDIEYFRQKAIRGLKPEQERRLQELNQEYDNLQVK